MIVGRRTSLSFLRSVALTLVSVACLGTAMTVATPVAAEGNRAGDVILVSSESGQPITEGERTTSWLIRLPDGAACQGDTADDDYRVQSFLAPASDDPGTFAYDGVQPVGEGRWSLYLETSTGVFDIPTDDAPNPGDPGLIVTPPPFSFVPYEGIPLSDGSYRLGMACTLDFQTTRYWDVVVQLDSSADDPSQLDWQVAESAGPVGSDGGGSQRRVVLAVGVLLVLAVGGVVVMWRRKTVSPESQPKEQQ